jgi:hypothetical protein
MVNLFTQTTISTAKAQDQPPIYQPLYQSFNPLINSTASNLSANKFYTRPQMQVTKEGVRQRITSQSH